MYVKMMQRRDLLRKTGAGVATIVTTGLAGCGEINNPDSTDTGTPSTETETNQTNTETMTDTEEDLDTVTETENETLEDFGIPPYEFTEDESYTYDTVVGMNKSEEKWLVTNVDGDNLTVKLETTTEEQMTSISISGTHGNIFDKASETERENIFPLLRGPLIYPTKGEMTEGNTFTVDTSDLPSKWDSETVTVLGDNTINGIDCTELQIEPGGDYNQLITVNIADTEDYPFALAVQIKEDGVVQFDTELLRQNRP